MQKPRYGIDAPGLVRFFFAAGAGALALLRVSASITSVSPKGRKSLVVLFGMAPTYLLGMGTFMIYGSKVMKIQDNKKLLDLIDWSGEEVVLDVGCGRGLMLIGAAKRLTTGKAIGIDLWQQQDQADNSAAAALENAQIEGVAQRVEVQTADMRELPFPDSHFDVVTSNWTIHNLEAETDRQTALNEIIRVLKPNGTVVLNDIVHQEEYAKYLTLRGMDNVQLHNNGSRDAILKAVSFGSFSPSAVSARKAA